MSYEQDIFHKSPIQNSGCLSLEESFLPYGYKINDRYSLNMRPCIDLVWKRCLLWTSMVGRPSMRLFWVGDLPTIFKESNTFYVYRIDKRYSKGPSADVIPSMDFLSTKDLLIWFAWFLMDNKPSIRHLLPIHRRECPINIRPSIALLWI